MNRPLGIARLRYCSLSLCAVLSLFMSIGCAFSGPAGQSHPVNKNDPYEDTNRKIYKFNSAVDKYVAAPVSDAYRFVTPKFVQIGIANVFANIKNINVVLNDVLQAKFVQGGEDTGRFVINSTLGLAGLFDVAKTFSFQQHQEDFDQTLAVWGFDKGHYLIVPFMGPSTVRGIPGMAFDTATNPTSYVATPFQALSMLNARANAEGALKFIDEAALDPYVFTRESFLQWRDNLASDGKFKASTGFEEGDLEDDDLASTKKPVTDLKFGFAGVAKAFVMVGNSFDQTALQFAEANDKLDMLEQQISP